LHAIVALSIRLGIRPTSLLDWSEREFLLCLAHLKLEANDSRERTGNQGPR
jgi:hypothetical protein